MFVQLRPLSSSQFSSSSALGSVFLPSSLTTGLSSEEQQQATRVQFTFHTKSALFQVQHKLLLFFQIILSYCSGEKKKTVSVFKEMHCTLIIKFFFILQDTALDNQTLVSPVLGCSVANLSISNLTENIQFTIRNVNPPHVNVQMHACCYLSRTEMVVQVV